MDRYVCQRKLVRDPIHALGMLFMKTCEFSAAGLGYLVSSSLGVRS